MIESPFLNVLRGVIGNRPVDPEVAKVLEALGQSDEFRYLTEQGYVLSIASGRVAQATLGKVAFGDRIARFADIASMKDRARLAQVFHDYGDDFAEFVNRVNPRAWRTMTEAYGTTVPGQVAEAFLKERMALASGNIDEAMAAFDAVRPAALSGPDGETIWQAFRDSFRHTSEQAFATHFFRVNRGWLERTLNHPFLGLYPLSYMYGKVLPEFARFLFLRPFGLNAPLLGIDAYHRVQQTVAAVVANDPDLRKTFEENPEFGYFVAMLIPGDPANLTVRAPGWARHIAENVAEGQPVTPGMVTDELADSAGYALGGLKYSIDIFSEAAESGRNIGEDLFFRLDKAAKEFDGMYPSALPRPTPNP
jgi:hypothetical protein